MQYISVKILQITIIALIALTLLLTIRFFLYRQQQMKSPIVFAIIADVQYADKDAAGSRHYRASLNNLAKCVEHLNDARPSFTIQVGDIIDGGSNAETELDNILAVYNKLTMPNYHVLGNHDFTGISRSAVMDKMKIDRAYYDFTIDTWRFIVLDTMDIATTGGWPEDSSNYLRGKEMIQQLNQAGAPNAHDWNGGISDEQMKWLDSVLTDADDNDQRAIIFAHNPVMPEGDPHNAFNDDQIVTLLQSHTSPAAYLNGHNHHGGYSHQNGIDYVTFKAMVDSPIDSAYAIVELHPGRIVITGTGNQPTKTLQLH